MIQVCRETARSFLKVFVLLVCAITLLPQAEAALWKNASSTSKRKRGPSDFRVVTERVNLAVVNIWSTQRVEAPASQKNKFEKPSMRQNLGSGFFINPEGYILTNHHVVLRASKILVTTATGNSYNATLIGADPLTDTALIKAQTRDQTPFLYLGNSERLKMGEWVLALGNPFGFQNSVSHGIVSATGRVISGSPAKKRFDRFIQTDASINPGNSGGPLVNLAGHVIGINTAITSAGHGIGFAVPINVVKSLLPDLKNHGYAVRGWVGLVFQELNDDIREIFNLKVQHGLLILDVVEGSPAAAAGFRSRDILLTFAGEKVARLGQISEKISTTKPGARVNVTILRDGRPEILNVKIASLMHPPKTHKKKSVAEQEPLGELGIEVKKRGRREEGVLIEKVDRNGPAALAGIEAQDVLLEISIRHQGADKLETFKIEGMKAYKQAIAALRSQDSILLLVDRDGRRLYVAFRLSTPIKERP